MGGYLPLIKHFSTLKKKEQAHVGVLSSNPVLLEDPFEGCRCRQRVTWRLTLYSVIVGTFLLEVIPLEATSFLVLPDRSIDRPIR